MTLLVEDVAHPLTEFHYCISRASASDRQDAENYLVRQGCTKVLHFVSPDGPLTSYGIVEPVAVVRQRALEPRYD